jgi:hypothetical protein
LSTLKDVISARKEVLLLTDKVERTGGVLTEISKELREHDRRLVRLETLFVVVFASKKPLLFVYSLNLSS